MASASIFVFALVLGDASLPSDAFAACLRSAPPTYPPTVQGAPTANADNIICNADNQAPSGNYVLNSGNDYLVVNDGASFTGSVQGAAGNDVIVINDGNISGNLLGDSTGTAGTDRIFIFDGTVGGEVQNGQGPNSSNDFVFAFGGTMNETIEAQRGSVNDVVVIDGATVDGLEVQSSNNTYGTAVNPTFYLRSGTVGSDPTEDWGNKGDEHFIIDPVNSKDPAYFQTLANDPDADLSTDHLNTLIGDGPDSAPANPDPNHLLIIDAEESDDYPDGRIALGNGNDDLSFVGAVNNGDGIHNLQFGDENEAPLLDGDGQLGSPPAGTPGTADTLNVKQQSNIVLGDVINFEYFNVSGGSQVTMTGENYDFGSLTPGSGAIVVSEQSSLAFEDEDDPVITTDTVTITGESSMSIEGEIATLNANSLLVEEGSEFVVEGGTANVNVGDITVRKGSIAEVEGEEAGVAANDIKVQDGSLFSVEGDEVEVEAENQVAVTGGSFFGIEAFEEAELEAGSVEVGDNSLLSVEAEAVEVEVDGPIDIHDHSAMTIEGDDVAVEAESIGVTKHSLFEIDADEAELESRDVYVDGSSTFSLFVNNAELDVNHFELGAPDGSSSFKPTNYYKAFDPGGMLVISGPKADDDEAEASNEVAAEEDDDDGGDTPLSPAHVTFNVGDHTFANAGTINMLNGITGDTLAINGGYEADNGNLALDTTLGTKKTDRVTIDGPVDGTTTVYVNNLNTKTRQTAKDVTLVSAPDGGLSSNSFKLGKNTITGERELVDGAFAYKLGITNTKAFLHGDLLDQVPGYVTSPSVAQTHVFSEFGTLYQRMGEMRNAATAANPYPLKPQAWVRGNFSQANVGVQSGWDFDSNNQNVLFGADLGGFPGVEMLRVGVFGGYGNTDATVKATTFGRQANSSVDVNGWTEGVYLTYFDVHQPGVGFYFDGILKANQLQLDLRPGTRPVHASPDADSFSASGEIGYGIPFAGTWSLTPQGQLIGITVNEESFSDRFGVNVNPGDADTFIGRFGLQLQDSLPTASGGVIAPYVIANIYSNFDGDNTSLVNGTKLASDVGVTWGSIGGGMTASLGSMVDVYGSADYRFGDVEGWNGTVGLRARW